MNINTRRVKACLQSFDFKKLFIQELNWAVCDNSPLMLETDDQSLIFTSLAQQGGMVIYQAECTKTGAIPPYTIRRSVEAKVAKIAHEHIIIFVDKNRTQALWQWVKREQGKSAASREHRYYTGQTGEPLLQKLNGIAFGIDDLDEEGKVAITKVTAKVASAFNVEKITKRFYDEFKKEHDGFAKFIRGIKSAEDNSWYVSVMLNRLMFIYFIQKKGFLNKDQNYLIHKLEESKRRGNDRFYSAFLIPLFFEGFAKEKNDRSADIKQLLGDIPYLNGGIFQRHKLEEENPAILIPDVAFEHVFAFFDRYQWHLEYKPVMADNEINPDVLGYIFEQYINRKQMGAYYTKEDITGYNCRNTIIPALFDKLNELPLIQPQLFPIKDIEPYIYAAVKQEEYLPTETDREYSARQERYQQIKLDFAAGKISNINDLITYNLDILSYAYDWARNIHDARVLRAFYFECLNKITVLDITVGSGAFLFAALNTLEPLYEICLDKMHQINCKEFSQIGQEFANELKRVSQHTNRKYFVFKSIIINNLYGVDIMEEAVEICKLRLFLKLVAQVDDSNKIEPLPDIDFNIRAGNSLVGYATLAEIMGSDHLDLSGAMKNIEERIAAVDRSLKAFRDFQTQIGIPASDITKAKHDVKTSLKVVQDILDKDLASFYGARDLPQFLKTHKPFHWIVEFYGIMKNGGFDVIIGNPPYVEYSKVRNQYSIKDFECMDAGNLYTYIIERSLKIQHLHSRLGMIIQLSAFCTPRMESFQNMLFKRVNLLHLSFFDDRPGKLFDGLEHIRVAIMLGRVGKGFPQIATTRYIKFATEFRPFLFDSINLQINNQPKHSSSILKVSTNIENEIVSKLWSKKHTLSDYLQDLENNNFVYYGYGFGYWGKVLNFKSYFKGEKVSASTGDKYIYCRKELDRDIVVATMNSSLFYWFYVNYSDGHNFTKHVIGSFPFEMPNPTISKMLKELCSKLMVDLKNNSRRKEAYYAATGLVKYDEYVPKLSKNIIDEIDRVLAEHYGFTEEELDFIINYDIKYRMGKDDGESDEDD